MYRLTEQSLLGLNLQADQLHFSPRLPVSRKTFKLRYRYRDTFHHITVLQHEECGIRTFIIIDIVAQSDDFILLVDDHKEHAIEVRLCASSAVNTWTRLAHHYGCARSLSRHWHSML